MSTYCRYRLIAVKHIILQNSHCMESEIVFTCFLLNSHYMKKIRGPFEKFVDWWHCATVMPPSAYQCRPLQYQISSKSIQYVSETYTPTHTSNCPQCISMLQDHPQIQHLNKMVLFKITHIKMTSRVLLNSVTQIIVITLLKH